MDRDAIRVLREEAKARLKAGLTMAARTRDGEEDAARARGTPPEGAEGGKAGDHD